MPLNINLKRLALTTAICVVTASTVFANETAGTEAEQLIKAKLIEDAGGTERINFSGKLRMLSQRLPAAACNLHAGVNVVESKKILAGTTAEFEKIVLALKNGDPSLGINGAEERRKTLAALDAVTEHWAPIGAAAHLMLDEGSTESLTQQLADQNGPLLEAAKLLVSEITGEYSNPAELIQADALRIDIAGRQRMLSQRISKDACMALSGINAEASLESMTKAVGMFDVSLEALQNGMPAAGIKASTNPDIVAGLELVAHEWATLHPLLDDMIAGGTWDMDARASAFDQLNTILIDMNKVVVMYSQVGKQQT